LQKQLPPASNPSDCHLSTQYIAQWKWDLIIYIFYAEIKAYEDDRMIGKALYDARKAGLDKFINAEVNPRAGQRAFSTRRKIKG